MQISIVISFDNGKESKAQRKLRIAETHNGATTRPRVIGDKRKKAPRYKTKDLD